MTTPTQQTTLAAEGASPTLAEALEHTYRTRWAHARDGGKCLYSQARIAMAEVIDIQALEEDQRGAMRPERITRETIQRATARWYLDGLSPATITKRLNCLSAMGVPVSGMRPPKERNLKWWLRPEEEARALAYLSACLTRAYGGSVVPPADIEYGTAISLMHHIRWTTKTGLRVEETLRLRREHFNADFTEVGVPGLKTSSSQATLPLGEAASIRAQDLLLWHKRVTDYTALEAAWRKLRAAMGWPQAATLKALRRSAARYLHVDCGMPLHMVQQYLRHENINTTLDYLRLTGGYGTEEMRRFLK